MLDAKIAPLVKALNELDSVTTIGSCQGHPKGIGLNGGNGYKTPYVIFQSRGVAVQKIRELTKGAKLKCSWVIDDFNSEKSLYSLTAISGDSFSLAEAWSDIEKLTVLIRGKFAI